MKTKDSSSVGTQAGIFDTRMIASYVLELLEKCHEIHDVFKKCQEDLVKSRDAITQNEQVVNRLNTTVEKFGDTMDSLGVNLLQDNLTLVKMNTQIDKLKREIAAKKKVLAEKEAQKQHTERWERLQELRQEREKLELQLKKVNDDIDTKYEETFVAEEKLADLKELRVMKRDENKRQLALLKDKASNAEAKRLDILNPSNSDTVDMSELYVSPAAFRRLETEIEDMRHQQLRADRHIQMMLDERTFLRDTANEILQRVFDLEKKVRKENGDHGWESALTKEPNWYPDLGAPTMWYTGSPLTVTQLHWMRERRNRNLPPATVVTDDNECDNQSKSETGSEDIVVLDLSSSGEAV